MKQLIPEYNFTDEQLNTISSLASAVNLTPSTVKILYARGIDSKEKIEKFLAPSKQHFLDPYLMSGMKEAIALIRKAKEENLRVAVFGDYDADGICASTIMYKALKVYGITPYVYIPERSEGYGLSVTAIDRILSEYNPDLFITVDCGISNAEQVEYLIKKGIKVIVSDHHELPEILPDCICVNPKFHDDYPYDNLCGAGVAFKIGVALIGEKAYDFIDFAAIATVADSVPLLGENRDIVAEGLKYIKRTPRLSYSSLLGKNDNEVTAQTLAFTVAPRINAAGRMGDAGVALRLFLSDDPSEIFSLAVKLNEYNTERQRYCDVLYESAKEKLKAKGAYGNVIMLYDESWNSGFVGIVAARIAEEFCRPTILFVKNGNSMKGSARSIESINIFDALRNCSSFISEFGGHAQAAGVNIVEENFDALERALNEYIGKTYSADDFVPKIQIAEEIESEFSLSFARELNMLEPYGVGHKKPLFSVKVGACNVKEMKANSPHLMIKCKYIDLIYFGGARAKRLIQSDVEKRLVFECNISHFRGKETIKGFVRDVVYNAMSGNVSAGIFANTIYGFAAADNKGGRIPEKRTHEEICRIIEEKNAACAYGLCLIATSRAVLKSYPDLKIRNIDLYKPTARNVENTIIISPSPDVDLSAYSCIIFLDEPVSYNPRALVGKESFVNVELNGCEKMLKKLDTDRSKLLSIFSSLRKEAARLTGADCLETAKSSKSLGFDIYEFIFALSVFEELGLISFDEGKIEVYRGVKTDLNDSKIYTTVCRLKSDKE